MVKYDSYSGSVSTAKLRITKGHHYAILKLIVGRCEPIRTRTNEHISRRAQRSSSRLLIRMTSRTQHHFTGQRVIKWTTYPL